MLTKLAWQFIYTSDKKTAHTRWKNVSGVLTWSMGNSNLINFKIQSKNIHFCFFMYTNEKRLKRMILEEEKNPTHTKMFEYCFAYYCISEHSKHFYFFFFNLHFLSGQGFCPPIPLANFSPKGGSFWLILEVIYQYPPHLNHNLLDELDP